MKTDPRQRRLARKLVQLSLEDGLVSADKVREVLASVSKASGLSDRIGLLRRYRRLIAREIARHTAVVETPAELPQEVIRDLEQNLSRQYNRPVRASLKTNPSLLAGLRVRVGDDLMDASLAGRLQRLASSVR